MTPLATRALDLVSEMAKEPCQHAHALRGHTCEDEFSQPKYYCDSCRARRTLKQQEEAPHD